MYVSQKVNLEELCQGWGKDEDSYLITDSFDEEYCRVDINTRKIEHYGYNGMLYEWMMNGLICQFPNIDTDRMVFPQTIGDRTFYSSRELIEFVIFAQEKLKTIS